MQDIIPIFTSNFNGSQTQSIDARRLHEFLEVKTKFATCIQNRIQKYKFKENIDFISVSIFLENGGRTIEYHLSTNMAKQLTMVENNEKGEQARDYFIQKEEQANNQIRTPQIDSKFLLQIAQEMAEKEKLIELQSEKIIVLEIETQEQQEKIEVLQTETNDLRNLIKNQFKGIELFQRRQVANFLKGRGLDIKEYQITEYLSNKGWICKSDKNKEKATAKASIVWQFVNDLIPYTYNGVKKVREYGKFTVDGLIAVVNHFANQKQTSRT